MKTYHVIGLMSGTSLDGLDIAYCQFNLESNNYSFQLLESDHIPLNAKWKERLINAIHLNNEDLHALDIEYGEWMANQVNIFKQNFNPKIDFIASHGYTVFHAPEKGYTTQIGDGKSMAKLTGNKIICDFRSMDVSLGGQGAPLVPIGDRDLFNLSKDQVCVNIGGIANYTYLNEKVKGRDICAANLVLNKLANQINLEFDEDGQIAAANNIDLKILKQLNSLEFEGALEAISLHEAYFSILNLSLLSVEEKIATCTLHIAHKIAEAIAPYKNAFITGGGALNKHLIGLIQSISNTKIIIPSKNIIEFKEAIIFAYLGILKNENKVNCLASVTGASHDNTGGVIYQ